MNDPSIIASPADSFAPRVLDAQTRMNHSTHGQWAMYAGHREQLERVIVANNPGGRVCVLGAGNCNDLDLNWLTQIFRQVHLVDLDAGALEAGVRRQNLEPSSKLCLHAPIELTGITGTVSRWHQTPPSDDEIDQCLARLKQRLEKEYGSGLGGAGLFDVVLSPCLLSQLLISVRDAIKSEHPRYPELRGALRQRHLRTMADVLKPGGTGILAIDVASTDHFANLVRVPENELSDLMNALVRNGKCLRALAPAAMRAALSQQPEISQVQFTPPWRWRLGLSKAFLVYAITFGKSDLATLCQTATRPACRGIALP